MLSQSWLIGATDIVPIITYSWPTSCEQWIILTAISHRKSGITRIAVNICTAFSWVIFAAQWYSCQPTAGYGECFKVRPNYKKWCGFRYIDEITGLTKDKCKHCNLRKLFIFISLYIFYRGVRHGVWGKMKWLFWEGPSESNVWYKTDGEKEDRGPNGDVGIEGNGG